MSEPTPAPYAARLAELTAALARALDLDEVLEATLRLGSELLEASSSTLALYDAAAAALRFGHGTADPTGREEVGLGEPAPTALAARTRTPLYIDSPADYRAAFPGPRGEEWLAATQERAWAWLPLLAGDRLLGVVRFGFAEPRSTGPTERALMSALSAHCALAVERAQLLDEARMAAAALRLSTERYRTLVEATSLDVWRADPDGRLLTDMPAWRALTGDDATVDLTGDRWLQDVHPDDRDRVRDTWRACVRTQGVYDVHYRIRDAAGGWRHIRARSAPLFGPDGGVQEWVGTTADITAEREAVTRAQVLQRIGQALTRATTVDDVERVLLDLVRESVEARAAVTAVMDADTGRPTFRLSGYPRELVAEHPDAEHPPLPVLTDVISSGQPRFVADERALREALAGLSPRADALADLVLAAGDRSWCMLPLSVDGQPLGAFTLSFPAGHGFDEAERTFLLTVAANCAVALERARLFDQQQHVAVALQQALQADEPPSLPHAEAAVLQRSAPGAEVGGDWAEVLPVEGGAAVVLGDVMGRGVRAARVMAEVRAAVRAHAACDPDPTDVLPRLDRLFRGFDRDELVTLFYGLLCEDGVLRYASLGHLPPLLVPARGPAGYLEAGGSPPLGVELGPRPVAERRLAPQDLLVVASDGLVETRVRSLGDGLTLLQLHATAQDLRGAPPQQVCAGLAAAMLGGTHSDDDATVLAVRLTAGP